MNLQTIIDLSNANFVYGIGQLDSVKYSANLVDLSLEQLHTLSHHIQILAGGILLDIGKLEQLRREFAEQEGVQNRYLSRAGSILSTLASSSAQLISSIPVPTAVFSAYEAAKKSEFVREITDQYQRRQAVKSWRVQTTKEVALRAEVESIRDKMLLPISQAQVNCLTQGAQRVCKYTQQLANRVENLERAAQAGGGAARDEEVD